MEHIKFSVFDDDGNEVEHSLPAKMEVCYRCEGYGTHLNPNIGDHGYTREEFDEAFDDEGKEEYFKHGGIYDVTCMTCNGLRVIPMVDESACKSDDLKKVLELYYEYQQDLADDRATEEAERRMGC